MNFLFVCTANRFRSKLQCAYADRYLKKYGNFDSCGIGSKKYGLVSPKKIIMYSKELKDIEEKIFLLKSKEINKDLINWADIIVYQQKSHYLKIRERFPKIPESKFVFLGQFYDRKITRVTDLAFVSDKKQYKKEILDMCKATKKMVKNYAKK